MSLGTWKAQGAAPATAVRRGQARPWQCRMYCVCAFAKSPSQSVISRQISIEALEEIQGKVSERDARPAWCRQRVAFICTSNLH